MKLLKELLTEERRSVPVSRLSSGFSRRRETIDRTALAMRGEQPIVVRGRHFRAVRRLNGRQLAKGMLVLASYNKYNQGTMVYEILGVTGDEEQYGEGGVKYNSVKEALVANGVKSLKALEEKDSQNEYGYHHYLVVRDLDTGESGPWVYLFNGRWSVSSGAEPISLVLLEPSKEARRADVGRQMQGLPSDEEYQGDENL